MSTHPCTEETPGLSPGELAAHEAVKAGASLPFSYKSDNHPSRCNLVVAQHPGEIVVLLSERPDNPGNSVTNCFEWIATTVHQQFLPAVDPRAISWLEHYPAQPSIFRAEEVDRVKLIWDDETQRYKHPKWTRVLPPRKPR